MTAHGFRGAKAALIHAGRLAVLRRDDIPTIDWPGLVDLPGGARDPGETPAQCVLREIAEETGLCLGPDRLAWSRAYTRGGRLSWFFAGALTGAETRALRLGDEGQALWMMPLADYLAATDAIPHLQEQVRGLLAEGAIAQTGRV